MSTRAVIGIEGNQYAMVYKHSDGYPSGTLPWLLDFNADFTKVRGDDPDYKMAQLVRSTVTMAEDYDLQNDDYLGWGIVSYENPIGDVWINYWYQLNGDGSVTVTNCRTGESKTYHEGEYDDDDEI